MNWIGFILLALLLIVIAGAIYYRLRLRTYSAANVEFRGAVRSILDGEYPKLSPFLVKLPDVSIVVPEPARNEIDENQATVPGAVKKDITVKKGAVDSEITQVSAVMDKTDTLRDTAKNPKESQKEAPKEQTPPPAESGEKPQAKAEITVNDMPVPDHIFREYDIRGLVETELSPTLVRYIGRAIGSEIRAGGRDHALIGRDNRESGEALIRELAKGLISTGVNLTNLGVTPTPVMHYSLHTRKVKDGIMLTGSHNDYRYNGIKIVLDGVPLSPDRLKKLRDRVLENDYWQGRGRLSTVTPFSDYAQELLDKFKNKDLSFHIAVDCSNGVTSAYVPFILRKLGCQVTELSCGIAPGDSSQAPDPTDPANLAELIECIRASEGKIHFGLAYDGDGDRLIVVDGNGHIVWPDRIMMLFADDVLKDKPGASIVYDVKCSRHLHSRIEQQGGKPIMWKTGHSLIRSKMREEGADLAGEMSGHIFFSDDWYGFDDAIYASCRLISILAEIGKSPTEVLSALPGQKGSPEYRIPLPNERSAEAVMNKARGLCEQTAAKVVDIDGLRLEYPNRWGLLRPSNTMPVLVCRFEGDDDAALATVKKEFKDMLQKIDSSLSIPF